jgi:hypothetical protein
VCDTATHASSTGGTGRIGLGQRLHALALELHIPLRQRPSNSWTLSRPMFLYQACSSSSLAALGLFLSTAACMFQTIVSMRKACLARSWPALTRGPVVFHLETRCILGTLPSHVAMVAQASAQGSPCPLWRRGLCCAVCDCNPNLSHIYSFPAVCGRSHYSSAFH